MKTVREIVAEQFKGINHDNSLMLADSILSALKEAGLIVVNEEEYRALCEIRDEQPPMEDAPLGFWRKG